MQQIHKMQNSKNINSEKSKQIKMSNLKCTILPNGEELEKSKTWVFSAVGSIR